MNYIEVLHKQLISMSAGVMKALPGLVIALLIVFLTHFLARFAVKIADRITGRTKIRSDLKQLLDTMVRIIIWIVGLLIAATVAIPSFTPAGAFASLGIGAVAIGFAFQDIFQNFLAGVLIMLRDKMNVGDIIECQGITGRVERFSLRETHVRQLSNELTIVPNSMLFKNAVKILTDATIRRNDIIVGVSYDTDLDFAEKTIRDALENIPAIHRDKPIVVVAQELSASSVDFLVQWWADSKARDLRITKGDVVKAVKRALDDAGIEIPFPYVTNTFKEPLPVERAQHETQARD